MPPKKVTKKTTKQGEVDGIVSKISSNQNLEDFEKKILTNGIQFTRSEEGLNVKDLRKIISAIQKNDGEEHAEKKVDELRTLFKRLIIKYVNPTSESSKTNSDTEEKEITNDATKNDARDDDTGKNIGFAQEKPTVVWTVNSGHDQKDTRRCNAIHIRSCDLKQVKIRRCMLRLPLPHLSTSEVLVSGLSPDALVNIKNFQAKYNTDKLNIIEGKTGDMRMCTNHMYRIPYWIFTKPSVSEEVDDNSSTTPTIMTMLSDLNVHISPDKKETNLNTLVESVVKMSQSQDDRFTVILDSLLMILEMSKELNEKCDALAGDNALQDKKSDVIFGRRR